MQNKCILCGQVHPAGLSIGGCFLCFPCERSLLRPASEIPCPVRRRLLALYPPAVLQ